jgi:cob(I)alamin adenosyltransferase
MTTTQKPAVKARASRTARARAEDQARRIEHIQRSLEAIQKDLGSIGGSLGTGARDLRRDTIRLLRAARRDLAKMGKAVERDLDRLQKDLVATTKPPVSDLATPVRRHAGATPRPRSARRHTERSH